MPKVKPRPRKVDHRLLPGKFTIDRLEALARDLKTERVPLKRMTISDDLVPGLRALIRNSGIISYHVSYDMGDSRPFIKLGEHPGMTIADAREIARTILSLSRRGIDVEDGLHARLIKELKRDGTNWRPK